jgi:hypothetical protein
VLSPELDALQDEEVVAVSLDPIIVMSNWQNEKFVGYRTYRWELILRWTSTLILQLKLRFLPRRRVARLTMGTESRSDRRDSTYSSLGLIPQESNIVPFWETGQLAQWLNQANHWSVTIQGYRSPGSTSSAEIIRKKNTVI